MQLNEILSAAHSSNPLIKTLADVIEPLWHFDSVFVVPTKPGQPVTIQFRKKPEHHVAESDTNFNQLEQELKARLRMAGVKIKAAGFQELKQTFSATPRLSFTVILDQ